MRRLVLAITLCVVGAAASLTAASVRYLSTHSPIRELLTPLAYLSVGLLTVTLVGLIILRKWGDRLH